MLIAIGYTTEIHPRAKTAIANKQIKPPGNYSKPDTIAKYIEERRLRLLEEAPSSPVLGKLKRAATVELGDDKMTGMPQFWDDASKLLSYLAERTAANEYMFDQANGLYQPHPASRKATAAVLVGHDLPNLLRICSFEIQQMTSRLPYPAFWLFPSDHREWFLKILDPQAILKLSMELEEHVTEILGLAPGSNACVPLTEFCDRALPAKQAEGYALNRKALEEAYYAIKGLQVLGLW